MPIFKVRIDAPATWFVEIEAEDEDEADVKTRELLGDSTAPGHLPTWEVDLGEAEWSFDEGREV
jgi:hypothetical protein